MHTVHNPHAIFPLSLHTQKTWTTPTRDTHTNGDVTTPNNQVTDVYLLDDLGKPIIARTSNPFLMVLTLHGPNREQVRFLAVVDNGAMINAIDTAAFQCIARRLNPLSPSARKLRMANGSVVSSTGTWAGKLKWGPLTTHTTFEVFLSGGSWRMLIGKPLLEQVKATHDYSTDSISLPINNTHHHIYNFIPHQILPYPFLPTAISLPVHTRFSPPPTNDEQTNVHLATMEKTPPHTSQNIPGDVPSPPPPAQKK